MASAAPAESTCATCSAIQFNIDRLRARLADIESSTARSYRELRYSEIKERVLEADKIDEQLKKVHAEMKRHVGKAHRHEAADL